MKNLKFVVCIIASLIPLMIQSQIELRNTVAELRNTVNAEKECRLPKDTMTLKAIRYYYYPNLNAYYDKKYSYFIFKQNGEWIKNDKIASNYRGYSAFNNYHVEIVDYFSERPYELLDLHKKVYPCDFTGRIQKLNAQNASKNNTLAME